MLTQEDARYYDQQLHPAFAGYLHDGTITQRDALATIFNLLTRGSIDPIWKDNSILKGIDGVRLMRRQPKYGFEQFVIDKLFGSKRELSTKEVSEFIKSGEIQKLIKDNLSAISAFPIINEELKFTLGKHGKVNFSVNGNPVDTIEEATAFKRMLYKILLPIFLGIGILLLAGYVLFLRYLPQGNYSYSNPNISIQIQGDGNASSSLLLTGGIFIVVILSILFAFVFSKKTVSYSFKNDVVPIAQKKYNELYEFIKSHRLKPHRFTNEFLAFSIAFGLDNSWYIDFWLDEEIKIDESPLTEKRSIAFSGKI